MRTIRILGIEQLAWNTLSGFYRHFPFNDMKKTILGSFFRLEDTLSIDLQILLCVVISDAFFYIDDSNECDFR